MADNVNLTAGDGTIIAGSDKISGVDYPRVKANWGPDGTINDTDVASGKPFPVQLRGSDGTDRSNALPVTLTSTTITGTAAVTQSGTWTVQPGNTANTTAWKVDGSAVTQPVSGTVTANAGSGTLAVSLASVPSHAVTNAGTFATQSASSGDVAHDAVDSGNPVKVGFKATTALSGLTLVASADRTDAFAGVDGVQIVRPHCNLEDIVTGNATNTDGTSTQCIAAQSSGIKTYLTSIVLCNTSATAITVDIKDGTTVKISLPLPAGSGCVYNPPIPIPGTAATAWNFDGSAAATTVTCSMVGFKSKV